jgi:hypothetical protein
MRFSLLAAAFITAGFSAAQAAECTKTLQTRWEAAMGEAMQLRQLLLKVDDPDRQTLCRIVKNATELSTVGKDYFPACDPLDEDGRRVVLTKVEALLTQTDPSVCSPTGKSGSGKKS